jgi:valyl-tRNA synthetase
LELDELPWKHASISGWILDPDRKKMSKSKGNVVTPMDLLDKHGSDGVRYWSALARLGGDTAFDEGQMKIGRRLAIKVLNAAKFVLSMAGEGEITLDPAAVTEPLDRAMLAGLADVVDTATAAFENYDHTKALEATESFFWTFCDDYVELAKERAYGTGPAAGSAKTALAIALDVLLRLLAPFIPFATEEVWSWWRHESIHRQPWPTTDVLRLAAAGADPRTLTDAGNAVAALRKLKTEAKVPMKTPILSATLSVPADALPGVRAAAADIADAGKLQSPLTIQEASTSLDLESQGGITAPIFELGEVAQKG